MLMLIYVEIALLALVWRFVFIPWDFGGCFYQVWIAAIGTALAAFYPRLNGIGRVLAWVILLPIGVLLLFGSLYFAFQALFPFMLLAFALASALFPWSKKKARQAVLVSLLLIPLAAFCLYGLRHMSLVGKVRSIPPADVVELRFAPVSGKSGVIVLSNQEAITKVGMSLRHTFPYSPNHEEIKEPWRLTVSMRDGSQLAFNIGNGNCSHASFVWIQFGVEVYQNAQLREAFKTSGVSLWNAEQRRERPNNQNTGGDK